MNEWINDWMNELINYLILYLSAGMLPSVTEALQQTESFWANGEETFCILKL